MPETVELPEWPYPVIGQIRQLLTDAGLHEYESRIDAELSRQAVPSASVVVVGETNTGKSSLVNAIVGREGLVPVGPDVATNVHVIVRHGPKDEMIVYRESEGADGILRSDELDLEPWASVSGNPDNQKSVRAVEVTLDLPVLESGLTLIDTPGVGGLDTAHGRITLAALADADALLFVADPDRPMIQPELDFLRLATERIGTVVFVCSKIDVQAGWGQIMEEDRQLLAANARRFADAPWLGVSSTLESTAARWEREGRPAADVADLRQEAGVDELRSRLLRHVVDRVAFARRVSVLQLCQQAIEVLEQRQQAVADAGPTLAEQLKREEERLAALDAASAQWPLRVSDGFTLLRSRLQNQLADLVKEFGRRYGDSGLEPFMGHPDTLEESLLREVNAVGAELTLGLRNGVTEIEVDILELIAPAGIELTEADLPSAAEIAAVQATLTGGPDHLNEGGKVRNVRLAYSAVAQGMSFSGISHLAFLAALGVSSVSFFGVGMGFGALLAIAEAKGHRKQAKLQELRPLVQEALQLTQSKLSLQLQEAVLQIQRQLEAEARNRIKEEHRVAAETYQRCQQQMAASSSDQASAAAAANEQLAIIENLRLRCAKRVEELRAVLADATI